jgi:hypothetical protein
VLLGGRQEPAALRALGDRDVLASLMMMRSVCPQSGHLDIVDGMLVRSFARSVMLTDPLNN